MAKAAAKKAALEAKAATLKGLHNLQIEELKLQHKKTELQLRAEIAQAEAERQAYEEACASETGESYVNI